MCRMYTPQAHDGTIVDGYQAQTQKEDQPAPYRCPYAPIHAQQLPRAACLNPHIIFFALSSNTHTTTPATSAPKHSQNAQHIHVRCFFFLRWLSSHESLLDGSAVTEVQNLKRDCGRPDRPRVNCDELPCRVKGLCASEGLRGVRGDLESERTRVSGALVKREGCRLGLAAVGVAGCDAAAVCASESWRSDRRTTGESGCG